MIQISNESKLVRLFNNLSPKRKKILIIGSVVIFFLSFFGALVDDKSSAKLAAKDNKNGPSSVDREFDSAQSMTDHKQEDPSKRLAALVDKELKEKEKNSKVSSKNIIKPVHGARKHRRKTRLDLIESRITGVELEDEREDKNSPFISFSFEGEPFARIYSPSKMSKEERRVQLERKLLDRIKTREGLNLSHEELIERLVRGGLGDKDDIRAIEAGILLRELVSPEDARFLTLVLKQQLLNFEGRKFLIELIGRLGDRRSYGVLRDEFRNPLTKMEHKALVVDALGYLKDDRAIPLLIEVIQNYDKNYPKAWGVRALVALSRIGTSKAHYALTTDLPSDYALLQALRWSVAYMQNKVNLQLMHDRMPPGRKNLTLQYKGTEYYLYHPVLRSKNQYRPRLLVCIHGSDFNGGKMLAMCKKFAKDKRIAVLAPVFDPVAFPNFGQFNYRGENRPDVRLLELLDWVNKKAKIDTREIFMVGMGEGGSFVMNFAMAYPKRVSKYVVSEPKSLFKPETDLLYPDGMRRNPLLPGIKPDFRVFLKSDGLLLDQRYDKNQSRNKIYDNYYLEALKMGITPRLIHKVEGGRGQKWGDIVKQFLFPEALSKRVHDL